MISLKVTQSKRKIDKKKQKQSINTRAFFISQPLVQRVPWHELVTYFARGNDSGPKAIESRQKSRDVNDRAEGGIT